MKKSTARRIAGRMHPADNRVPVDRRKKQGRKRPTTRLVATLGTAVTALLVAMLTSIQSQIFDTGSVADAVRGGPDINVSADVINDDSFYTMAVPGNWSINPNDPVLSQVDGSTARSMVEQERSAGGFATPYLRVRLLLEGHRSEPIQITDLAVTNLQVKQPIDGTLVAISGEAGAENQQVRFDLNDAIPKAIDEAATNPKDNLYFKNKSITLADKEQIILLAKVEARKGKSAEFNLALTYTLNGQEKSMVIANGGRPFRVTAPSCNTSKPGTFDYHQVYTEVQGDSGFKLAKAADPHSFEASNLLC